MSVATEVSSSLFWHPFEGSVDKEPLFVQYTKYTAQSANTSDISWYIESPANGVLLDNEVWIRYTLRITDNEDLALGLRAAYTVAGDDARLVGYINDNDMRSAFRFGCTLQKACQNISLDINGTVMTYEFSKFHDAFNRLFITDEESKTVFPSNGGGFDNGSHSGLFDGYCPSDTLLGMEAQAQDANCPYIQTHKYQLGVNTSNPAGVSKFIGNEKLINYGFSDRADWLEYLFRVGGSISDKPTQTVFNNTTLDMTAAPGPKKRYANPLKLVMYEKIAIPPFHLYDNRDIKMSIPNIRTLQLTLQLHSNYQKLMFRCASGDGPAFDIDWVIDGKPQLLLRWYTPPPGYQIPKQITIPCSKVLTYTSSEFGTTIKAVATPIPVACSSFSKSNISLPAMPDLFLIYLKRRISEYNYAMPDDYNLSIYSFQMDMEGNSGKLIAAEPIHTWNMYKRHLRLYPCGRDTFDSWYKYHCIIPITASDLGVIKGAGLDNPIQVTISNLLAYDYHNVPSIDAYVGDGSFNKDIAAGAVAFDFHMVCIYDKYALTLTSDGSSALQLLRVNTSGTSTSPPMGGGPSSLADIAV